jgi:hypothetical protein
MEATSHPGAAAPPAVRTGGAVTAKDDSGSAGEATVGTAESIKVIGGLVALATGVVVVGLVAGAAMIAAPSSASSIAAAAFGVIGSTVGAYFGVKIGSDGTQKAVEAQRQEAAKATVYAAHLQPGQAHDVIQMAQQVAEGMPISPESRPAVPPPD